MKRRVFVSTALVTLVAFSMTVAVVFAGGTLSNPIWDIYVNDAGYSDAMYYSHDGVTHEMLSGEWAAAIQYDGIDTPGGESMWLTPWFSCPSFATNSTFSTVVPFSSYDDPANPVSGEDTGSAVIGNGQVEVAIQYQMVDAQTAMSIGAGAVLSGQYVLLHTYEITNVSGDTLTNVDFFQFLHGQPNDSYGATNYGAYDDTAYGFGDFQDFRYDVTQWGEQFIYGLPGSDIVGFSSNVEPSAYGIGEFPSDYCSGGRPSTGLHIDVENDTLPMNNAGGPLEIAGAMKWSLGDLAPGASTELQVLLSAGTNPTFPPEPASVPGRMTGGGSVLGSRVTHGFTLDCDVADGPKNLQINWGRGNGFYLENLTSAYCSDDPDIEPVPPGAPFDTYRGAGEGRYNGASGATIEFMFTDAGQPGVDDIADIVITDAGGDVVLDISGNLQRGDHQALEEALSPPGPISPPAEIP